MLLHRLLVQALGLVVGEEAYFLEVGGVDEVELVPEGLLDLLREREGVELADLFGGGAAQESVDRTERGADVEGQLLQRQRVLVEQVGVGAVDQLDRCVVVEVLQNLQVVLHFFHGYL